MKSFQLIKTQENENIVRVVHVPDPTLRSFYYGRLKNTTITVPIKFERSLTSPHGYIFLSEVIRHNYSFNVVPTIRKILPYCICPIPSIRPQNHKTSLSLFREILDRKVGGCISSVLFV